MAKQSFVAGPLYSAVAVGSPDLTTLQTNDFNWSVSTKTASHVLVAADAGTRVAMNAAGATTITVNTALFAAGDTVFLQNLAAGGVCTITAGTATVSTTGVLALAANAGGILYFVSTGVAMFFGADVAGDSDQLVLSSQVFG